MIVKKVINMEMSFFFYIFHYRFFKIFDNYQDFTLYFIFFSHGGDFDSLTGTKITNYPIYPKNRSGLHISNVC